MIIDAHQHLWDRRRARYDWLTDELAPINRDFDFDEVRPQLAAAGVTGTILVQAADNLEDTALMLEVAAHEPTVLGVVAYAPLEDAAGMTDALARYRDLPAVRGIRTLIHDQPDPGWLLRPDVMAGLGRLEAAGLTFDVVAVLPEHLEAAIRIGASLPGLPLVIDHLGHPPLDGTDQSRWRDLIAAVAENPRASAKVSGLYPDGAADPAEVAERIRPSFEHALGVFGAGRLMYGGDWPVSVLSGGYGRTWDSIRMLVEPLEASDRQAILSRTAARVYGIALPEPS